mmetsp:Transcript_65198/g.132459  ORF Transcript_65198/g.132459 Transcript_65198/m.132459 type:complete len:319 (-) Transcript_65198:43-999(-)
MASSEEVEPNLSQADEVSLLREEVGKLTQELLMHRKVLEQCLEVRESVLELLEHREALLQCLEMREGLQVIGEVVDRTSELDLSLAGVSDNTARHGRAIASLTEQQQRTTQTLDAVIRAVKRLDRSRSRQAQRPSGDATSVPSEPASARTSQGGLDARWSRAEDPDIANGLGDPWNWSGGRDGLYRSERPRTPGRRQTTRGQGPGSGDDRGPRQDFLAQAKATPQTSQMADCVKGVLSRINEALTKLDRSSQELPTFLEGAAVPFQDRIRSGEACTEPLMSHRGARPECKSPALVTPRAFVNAARPQDPSRRAADSWA